MANTNAEQINPASDITMPNSLRGNDDFVIENPQPKKKTFFGTIAVTPVPPRLQLVSQSTKQVLNHSNKTALTEVWGEEIVAVHLMVVIHPLRSGDPVLIFGYVCSVILYTTIMLPIYFVLILYRYSPAISALVGVMTVVLTNLKVSLVVTEVLASVSGILLSLAVIDKYEIEIPGAAHTTYFLLNKVKNRNDVVSEKNLIISSIWLSATKGKRVAVNNCEIFNELRVASTSLSKWCCGLGDEQISDEERNILNFLQTRISGLLIDVCDCRELNQGQIDVLTRLCKLISLCQTIQKLENLFSPGRDWEFHSFNELVDFVNDNRKNSRSLLGDLVEEYDKDKFEEKYWPRDTGLENV
jgi:hypothetical protein